MKVLIDAIPVSIGGGWTYVSSIIDQLVSRKTGDEYIVAVHTRAPLKSRWQANGQVKFICRPWAEPVGPNRLFWMHVYLRDYARRHQVDALFSCTNFGVIRPPCAQVAFMHNARYFADKTVDTHDCFFVKRARAALEKRMVYLGALYCQGVMVPSADLASRVTKEWPFLRRKVFVNPHGVSQHIGEQTNTEVMRRIQARKNKLRISGRKCCVAWVSRIIGSYKDPLTLLRAIKLVKEQYGKNMLLIMTVSENPASGECRECVKEFARAARAAKLADNVLMLGSIPFNQISSVYHSCGALVWTSTCESFGLPLIEAMANGVPTIAADTPVDREICGPAALYFPAHDAEELAKAIVKVFADDTLASRMIRLGEGRARHYSWRAHTDRLIVMLGDAVEKFRAMHDSAGQASEKQHYFEMQRDRT